MTADQHSPPPLTTTEPIVIRWATCAIGGAIAGILVGGWFIVFDEASMFWFSKLTLPNFIDSQIAMGAYQKYLDAWRILGPAAPGVVGGLLTALFSRKMRHPIALASLWASILSTAVLLLTMMLWGFGVMNNKLSPAATLVLFSVVPTSGVVYGFALGFSVRLMERSVYRPRYPE